MNLAVLAYIPPPGIGHPEAFLRNLSKFPARYRTILYSDSAWPGVIPLKGNPEGDGRKGPKAKPYAVSNMVFYTGMQVAAKEGVTHAIYLEEDCRVGRKDWDEAVFEDFFSAAFPAMLGGSVVCWSPMGGGMNAARKFADWYRSQQSVFPIPVYGCKGAAEFNQPCVFTNGAISVVDISAMHRLMDLSNAHALAVNGSAWDMEIGFRLWKELGADAYDVVRHLNTVYSGYGDILTTETERIKMLTDGTVVAVHQVRSEAEP
jgi:hypothetical protein